MENWNTNFLIGNCGNFFKIGRLEKKYRTPLPSPSQTTKIPLPKFSCQSFMKSVMKSVKSNIYITLSTLNIATEKSPDLEKDSVNTEDNGIIYKSTLFSILS